MTERGLGRYTGSMLGDSFGRIHDDLRVSVTDRCNLRCAYCMPTDPEWFPRERILRFEEIERIVRVAAGLGVRRVRLTGGEPLVRRDVTRLVERLARVDGIDDLSLTTNGVLLAPLAGGLRQAGLKRVNVSLDTLRHDRYRELTRRDELDRALAGIAAAIDAGLAPVKVNAVVLRDVNDDEVEALVAHAREHGWEMRFIEFMPLENGATWSEDAVVRGPEIRERIAARWPIDPDPAGDPRAPATRWRFRDGRGAVGFVDSISAPFCGDCGRLRLTSDGFVRVCLYDDAETDLKTPLRAGATDEELARLLHEAVSRKGRGGALDLFEQRGVAARRRTMHQIGG